AGASGRVASGHDMRRAQSRHYLDRDAGELLRRKRFLVSAPRRVGEKSRPDAAWPGAAPQRTTVDRPGLTASLFGRRIQIDDHIERFAFPENSQCDLLAWSLAFDRRQEIIDRLHGLAIHRHDDVGVVTIDAAFFIDERAAPRLPAFDANSAQTGALRRATRHHRHNRKPAVGVHHVRNTDIRANYATRLNKLRYDACNRADRDCEPNARVLPRRAGDRSIHSDQARVTIQQGTARVALIQRRIDLNDRFHAPRPPRRQRPVQARNDPDGHGALEPKWIANGKDALSDAQATGIAKHNREQFVGGRVDAQHGNVVQRILAHQAGIVLLAVEQRHADLPSCFDDVKVRQDVAVLVEHRAGSGSFTWRFKDEFLNDGPRRYMHDTAIAVLIDSNIYAFFRGERFPAERRRFNRWWQTTGEARFLCERSVQRR